MSITRSSPLALVGMACDVFMRDERRASGELRTFACTDNLLNHIKRPNKLTMQLTGFDCST